MSFPIVYLFHGKLIFTSPVTGSSLGSTARPVWLWPRLPSPVSGLYDLALGRTFKAFNSQVISMIQYCFCPNHLCCFLPLPLPPLTLSFFSYSFHLSFPNPSSPAVSVNRKDFFPLVRTCLFAEKLDLLHHDELTIKSYRTHTTLKNPPADI